MTNQIADTITVNEYDGNLYYSPLGEEFIKKSIHDAKIQELTAMYDFQTRLMFLYMELN